MLSWSSHEDIPYVQGKRNPSKMVGVARGHQRADTLKPKSQKSSQSDHMDHSLSNSVKLSHAVWGHPRQEGLLLRAGIPHKKWSSHHGQQRSLKCSTWMESQK